MRKNTLGHGVGACLRVRLSGRRNRIKGKDYHYFRLSTLSKTFSNSTSRKRLWSLHFISVTAMSDEIITGRVRDADHLPRLLK